MVFRNATPEYDSFYDPARLWLVPRVYHLSLCIFTLNLCRHGDIARTHPLHPNQQALQI